jgi:hypothetical protein
MAVGCDFSRAGLPGTQGAAFTSAEMRGCSDCGLVKPLDDEHFLTIKACKRGWHGRCRECRNRRARERYHSTEQTRRAEIARAWKNKVRRRAEAEPLAWDGQGDAT